MAADSLGEELSAALSNITSLIIKAESKSQRTKLARQQAQIAGKLQVFIDEVVDEALPEYKAATTALNAANAEAEAAKKDLDKVATAIKKFAAVIDKLAALAAKVAAAEQLVHFSGPRPRPALGWKDPVALQDSKVTIETRDLILDALDLAEPPRPELGAEPVIRKWHRGVATPRPIAAPYDPRDDARLLCP